MYLHRGPGFVRGVAEILQVTVRAPGLAGYAQSASVMDDLMREIDPFFLRDDFHQVLLDFFRVFIAGQLQAAGDAMHVREIGRASCRERV